MKIPSNWNNISVGQFQEAFPYYVKAVKETDTIESLENWCIVIAIVTNSQLEDVRELPGDKLKKVIKKLSFLGDSKINGRKRHNLLFNGRLYHAPRWGKEFSTSRAIEYKTFMGRDFIPNLHFILATIYNPVYGKQSHEVRANKFKSLKVGRVYPTVFFYLNRYNKLINRIRDYGLKVAREKQKEAQEILMQTLKESLENIGDGTLHSMK